MSTFSDLPVDTSDNPEADDPNNGQYPHAYTVRLVRLDPQEIRVSYGYRSADAALAKCAEMAAALRTGHILVVAQLATGDVLRRVVPDEATRAALEIADRWARGEGA